MPDPAADPYRRPVRRAALIALVGGVLLSVMKFAVFAWTGSVGVLSDALESLINIVAAAAALAAVTWADRPADDEHPYGHGNAQFLAVATEGWLVLTAGLFIAVEAIRRLILGHEVQHLDAGLWCVAGIAVLNGLLAGYVLRAGRQYQNPVLQADGRHLLTDVLSTVGVLLGLLLVQLTGQSWIDAGVGVLVAIVCFAVALRLMRQSARALMDRQDPEDDAAIVQVLDDAVHRGLIRSYHKVRHRHSGTFHWVDLHLQVDDELTVRQSHSLASQIERQIEDRLGHANATAHVEPAGPRRDRPIPRDAGHAGPTLSHCPARPQGHASGCSAAW